MRCILCDRCKKIVEDETKVRVATCARPLPRSKPEATATYRGDDRQMNDIIWMKELCPECAGELETFMSQTGSGGAGSSPETPTI